MLKNTFYYSTVMSFYYRRSRKHAEYEAVIRTLQGPGLTSLQQGEYQWMQKEHLHRQNEDVLDTLTENRSQNNIFLQ